MIVDKPIPAGQWHNLHYLESGTVLLECKDGPWAPLGEEDVLEPRLVAPAPDSPGLGQL